MSDLLLGMIGAVLLFAAAVLGFHLGKGYAEMEKTEVKRELTPEEKEWLRLEKEAIKAENDAWNAVAGYTANTAYGIGAEKLDGEKEEGRQ